LRQLKGKRVAIQGQANIGEFWLDVVLETAGLSSDDVMLVNLRIPEALAALTAGKIDAMVGAHSILDESRLASAQVVRSIGFGRVLPNFHTHHVLFGASLLAGDPERGSRFLAAYFQAVRDFLGEKRRSSWWTSPGKAVSIPRLSRRPAATRFRPMGR
jgi:ABC-type nitrate/sulfonate/bicarbonate transport system substrate-binding protein